jgi:peptide/nickel transport system substrate-binding protein
VKFKKATPFWADAFVGTRGMILPKHLFADFIGAKSRDAPTNLKPVGTGPYKFVDFKPGDMVTGVMNPNYHQANKPYFDSVEMKGGGDAVSAARAVLQTGEFDFAWNLQVEDEILKRLEKGGKGSVSVTPGGNIEFILLNTTDPWTEVDGERSSLKTKHPTLQRSRGAQGDCACWSTASRSRSSSTAAAARRRATSCTVRRASIAKNNPIEFNVDKANEILEKAGWKKGADGIRAKDGKKLKFVYQTSINQPRQKTQAIIKQAAQKAGIDIELKSVTASVFFSSDVANPDTYTKFYTDLRCTRRPWASPIRAVHAAVRLVGERPARRTSGRAATSRAGEPRGRQALPRRAEVSSTRQARRAVHQAERPRGQPHRHGHRAAPDRLGAIANNNCNISGWDNNTWTSATGTRTPRSENALPFDRGPFFLQTPSREQAVRLLRKACSSRSRACSGSASCSSPCWRWRRAIPSRNWRPTRRAARGARRVARQVRLDDPIWMRYWHWLTRCCRATGASPSSAASTSTR